MKSRPQFCYVVITTLSTRTRSFYVVHWLKHFKTHISRGKWGIENRPRCHIGSVVHLLQFLTINCSLSSLEIMVVNLDILFPGKSCQIQQLCRMFTSYGNLQGWHWTGILARRRPFILFCGRTNVYLSLPFNMRPTGLNWTHKLGLFAHFVGVLL